MLVAISYLSIGPFSPNTHLIKRITLAYVLMSIVFLSRVDEACLGHC